MYENIVMGRQNNGKFSVYVSPPVSPFHSSMYHHVSNLSIIPFYSFAVLTDVKGAMLTAR